MAQSTSHETNSRQAVGQSIRTVIVDDSPLFLERILKWLKREPDVEVVGQAGTGDEAIIQVQSLHPDLVLMDLAMAGVNGIQAAKKMKQEKDPPAVILMSVHDLSAFRKHWIGHVDGVIGKNDFATEFPALLRMIFSRSRGHGATPSPL